MHIIRVDGLPEWLRGREELRALLEDLIPVALATVPGLRAGPHDLVVHPQFAPDRHNGSVLSGEVLLSRLPSPDALRPEVALALAGGQLLVVLASFAERQRYLDAVVQARFGSDQVCCWWHNPDGIFADTTDQTARLGVVERQLQRHLGRLQMQLQIAGEDSSVASRLQAACEMTQGLLRSLDMADVLAELRAARGQDQ